jgi:recombination associated protein RdgC
MFKNIQFFKVNPTWNFDILSAEEALNSARFVECGLSQEESFGWIEPRGESNGLLIESVGYQWIAKIMFESKILPGSVVKEAVDKRAIQIEAQTGRKPGKKEKKEIKENVRNELLAKAFTKKSSALVWIDPATRFLVIEASSQSRADEIITALVKSLEGFGATTIQTQQSAVVSMSQWLDSQEAPEGFTADRDCTLKSSDESKASVRYAKHPLDIDEIRTHIANGKLPTQLAMTWDRRVSFVLTDTGSVKKIEFLDVTMDGKVDSGFDADVVIATGELSKMIPAIIESLGGEHQIAI